MKSFFYPLISILLLASAITSCGQTKQTLEEEIAEICRQMPILENEYDVVEIEDKDGGEVFQCTKEGIYQIK